MANQNLTPEERREASRDIRNKAADIAFNTPIDNHIDNGDEGLPKRMMSFTKGLPHNPQTGLIIDEGDFEKFKDGICSGDPAQIKNTPLGPIDDKWLSKKGQAVDAVRAWESSGAGLTFDLQGPDAQAITMPPAPKLGSDELTAELAEVYCQAILRDIPFTEFTSNNVVEACINALNQLPFFREENRNNQALTINNAFRGFTEGDLKGPYISQFLLAGNNGLTEKGENPEFDASEGKINYGSITIDQRVRKAAETDYMTNWEEYIDVQNGADFRDLEKYDQNSRRFITSGRDLATYVHYDALYEAYLNACLIMLGYKFPFDQGVPFKEKDAEDKQQGFAHYGPPHILTLVTEVATRALKAVRFQKFNVHRRLRPEALAARMERKDEILHQVTQSWDIALLTKTFTDLDEAGIFDLLQNYGKGQNLLLPMAFCEGSPMHPSYGAGHATVAGACVTILKAFFNHNLFMNISADGSKIEFSKDVPPVCRAFVPNTSGNALEVIVVNRPLTVADELNKLAANISIGRDWAGVHYYSDYKDSMLLGEEIAIKLLREQAITYNPEEGFYLTLTKFEGKSIRIDANGVTSNTGSV